MSSAVMERIIDRPGKMDQIQVSPEPDTSAGEISDPHPLLPVFIAGAISLMLAGMFIGSILVWLSLRHSGVMVP